MSKKLLKNFQRKLKKMSRKTRKTRDSRDSRLKTRKLWKLPELPGTPVFAFFKVQKTKQFFRAFVCCGGVVALENSTKRDDIRDTGVPGVCHMMSLPDSTTLSSNSPTRPPCTNANYTKIQFEATEPRQSKEQPLQQNRNDPTPWNG